MPTTTATTTTTTQLWAAARNEPIASGVCSNDPPIPLSLLVNRYPRSVGIHLQAAECAHMDRSLPRRPVVHVRMRFLHKPHSDSIRKRFAWWPTRLFLEKAVFFPTGEPDVYYTPGLNSNILSAPTTFTHPTATVVKRMSGGMFTPIRSRYVNVLHCWAWLEWVVEECYTEQQTNRTTRLRWRTYDLPEQLMLWNEYV